eukprot:1905965-Amphidinium_carterae.1
MAERSARGVAARLRDIKQSAHTHTQITDLTGGESRKIRTSTDSDTLLKHAHNNSDQEQPQTPQCHISSTSVQTSEELPTRQKLQNTCRVEDFEVRQGWGM